MGEVTQATRATVKGHNLTVGTRLMFHGMASDSFPAIEGTLCVLGKEGNKYTVTTVDAKDNDPTGKPWVWTFGAAAALWASPVECVCDDIIAAGVDALPVEGRECPCGGSFARPGTEAAGVPAPSTTNPWGECGPCDGTDAPMARQAHPCGLTCMRSEVAPVVVEIPSEIYPGDVVRFDPTNPDEWEYVTPAPEVVEVPAYTALNPAPYADHQGHRKNLSGTHRGNRYCLDCEVLVGEPVEVPAPVFNAGDDLVSFKGQRVHVLGRAVEDGAWWYEVREYNGGAHSERLYAHESALSVYTYTPQLGDRIVDADSGKVHTITRADEFWIGMTPDRSIRLEHFAMHIATGALVPVTGEAEMPGTGEFADPSSTCVRTPRAGDTVYRESDGAQGVIRDVLVSGELDIAADGGAGMIRTPDELVAEGFEIISAAEVAEGERLSEESWQESIGGVKVKPMSAATADVLMPVGAPKISKPIMARLNKRTRKAGKRHAFAGKR